MAKEKFPAYGGQALIEGVLMRGTHTLAAAMRTPEGKIEIVQEQLSGIYRSRIRKTPLLRGLVILWDSLGLGTKFLTISANMQTGEEEKIEGPALFLTYFVSLVIGVGIFFLAPAVIGQWSEKLFGWSAWWSNLLEGVLRLLLLIAYLVLVGRIKEISRVFAYHGAEHKTINAFEAGAELTPESVDKYSTAHPRCGTGFLLSVALISIVLFTLLGPLPMAWRLMSRILLIPVIAGLAYEYMRWTADHLENPVVALLIRPNLMLQHLTTRKPELDMLEVSIASFNAMYAQEVEVSKGKSAIPQPSAGQYDADEGEYQSQQI
jgi:uncharacterized protein YqhQ